MRCRTVLLATLIAGACSAPPAPEPLADPRVVYATAFATPIKDISLTAMDGPQSDAWVVFESEERMELRDGQRYSVLAPAAAIEFFTTHAPEQAADLPDSGAVCLSYRELEGATDQGAYLLFEPGSGLYFFRVWQRDTSREQG